MALIDQALDISYATLQDIRTKTPPMVYAYSTYAFWNTWWRNAVKTAGDYLEGMAVLGSEGNAKHSGHWEDDNTVKKNITKRYRGDWVHADGSMLWNLIEMDINQSPNRIYDYWKVQYNACVRDLIDHIFPILFTGMRASTDDTRPVSINQWLRLGTQGSTGGWTGYLGRYNDGSTPGATFNVGGIESTASVNPGWASYYADHAGNIDDSLLSLLDTATLDLNFQAPTTPENLPLDKITFGMYTSKNVITKLNQFFARSDDNMGYNRDSHYGSPTFNGMPFVYTPPLDTANVSLYGTDPIIGINSSLLYPAILKGWNFKISKQPVTNKHNVMSLFIDLEYQIFCDDPRKAGFVISKHPSN
jgi:hypothetical protein